MRKQVWVVGLAVVIVGGGFGLAHMFSTFQQRGNAPVLTNRQWASVIAKPVHFIGRRVHLTALFGEVAPNAGGVTQWYLDPPTDSETVAVKGVPLSLTPGTLGQFWGTITGTEVFDLKTGGQETVPMIQVHRFDRQH